MALRWGIATAGKISHDFVTAMSTLPHSDHTAVAVAARDLERAREFACLHKIAKAYGSYKELARDPDVEIVYIGNLNPQHLEVAMLMLENGKHVLCEKPLCMNYKESKMLVDYAKEKKLFLMEAIWTRFLPVYVELREMIKSGVLGEIFQVNVDFGVPIGKVDRVNKKALGGGTVLDIGIYVLQVAQMVFGEEPCEVKATGHLNEEGVDVSMGCILKYSNGRTAVLSTNSNVLLTNNAVISGTKGSVTIPMFWCAVKMQLPDGTWKDFPNPETTLPFNFDNSCGLRYEAEECRRCIEKGLLESPTVPHSESLILAKLEDTIRRQIGVVYDQDL